MVIAAISCNETPEPAPEPEPDEKPVAPVVAAQVGDLSRTAVTFILASDSPGDYAWAILPADQQIADAEQLFEEGKTGMFDASNTATITYNQLEGGNNYTLYYAVRKINPYVYSELGSKELSTDFAYEDMITLEKVTTSEISYHIEMPEDANAYRHMIVDYNDFLFFQALVGATHNSYVSAFGLADSESKTFENKWMQNDCGSYPTYIYSDTEYLVIAGKSEEADIDSQVSANDVKFIKFSTPKAEVCPHKVKIEVSDITSLSAKVTFTPEEGVDRYRIFPMSEADYESFLFEGEEMLRRVVIGPWEDTSTEYRESHILDFKGLIPNSNYYICVMAFDKDMRELYIEKTFTTGEPVGPKPEVSVSQLETAEPWNNATVNVKLKNAVSAIAFMYTKQAVDDVLNAPGNEDLTMETVIRNNGVSLSGPALNLALSEDGLTMTYQDLSPNTEYVYAIMASNEEHVSVIEVFNFKTEAEPMIETTLFEKLKGEYTASIMDHNGKSYTFDVTITDGVNDATREAYRAENTLVCLGFDPCGVTYHSPQDLLDKGWANTEEEANRNYGPKWFLEVDENDNITTYKHAVASSSWDEVNQVDIIDYSAEGEAPMASFDGKTIWFKGTFNRYYASKERWELQSTTLIHDVTFDEEAGTVTVHPVTHYKSWSALGDPVTEYPGVGQSTKWYGGTGSKVLFCGGSELLLTRKAAAQSRQVMKPMQKQLSVPETTEININELRQPVVR